MNTLQSYDAFASLGIPDEQIHKLANHLATANQYVFEESTPQNAFVWLDTTLHSYVKPDEAELMAGIAKANFLDLPNIYTETGYDSCQSHRQLSKIVSEAILIGGLAYEGGLLGLNPGIQSVQELAMSTLDINEALLPKLVKFAATYGGNQDFLFPGVTKSSDQTPSLEHMAYKTLAGAPQTSVRTLTGVGGLRADTDWNHVTDLVTFADLKVAEDKRYYPGLGMFYILKNNELESLPACLKLKTTNPKLFDLLADFKQTLQQVGTQDYSGVSILCSTYIPKWQDSKQFVSAPTGIGLNLESDFHSPSYEFMLLRTMFEKNLSIQSVKSALEALKFALTKCWSFNSTIHLPWTSKLAPLSNDLVGALTNHVGDYANRYGVGHNGKSIEVVHYNYGNKRRYPHGSAGLSAYIIKTYTASEQFCGPYAIDDFNAKSPLWKKIGAVGFLGAALQELA